MQLSKTAFPHPQINRLHLYMLMPQPQNLGDQTSIGVETGSAVGALSHPKSLIPPEWRPVATQRGLVDGKISAFTLSTKNAANDAKTQVGLRIYKDQADNAYQAWLKERETVSPAADSPHIWKWIL